MKDKLRSKCKAKENDQLDISAVNLYQNPNQTPFHPVVNFTTTTFY